MLALPEGPRRSSLPVTPPNTPIYHVRTPSQEHSSSVILTTSGTFLCLSLCVTLCGLLGVLSLPSALYLSVFLTSVAFFIAIGTWLCGRVTVSAAECRLVCIAEVSVDAETQLTIRSWWPASLAATDVESNGTRVALENAERWVLANRPPCEEVSYVPEFLQDVVTETSACECSVCYDCLSSSAVRLRLCGHSMHADCLQEWFSTSGRVTCPLCRCDHAALLPEDAKRTKQPQMRLLSVRVQRVEEAM